MSPVPGRGPHRSPVLAAAAELSAAFAARDAAAALSCFVPGDDISYVGSEHSEAATGRAAVAGLLGDVFARDEAYSWRVTTASVREYRDCAFVLAEADGFAHTGPGEVVPFAYRLSGLLEPTGNGWRWRHCHGCEPTLPHP